MVDEQRPAEPDTGPLPVSQPPIQPVPRNQPPPEPIVVRPAATPPAGPVDVPDPEQLRQFEQFRQFQQFQQFQAYAQTEEGRRALGSGSAVGFPYPQPPPKRPLWKRVVAGRTFRKAVLALVVIIGLYIAYQHYFGTTEDNDVHGGAGPGQVDEPGRLSPDPRQAIIALYKLVAQGGGTQACTLVFDQQGGAQFAADLGAPDCPSAVTSIAQRVTSAGRNSYAAPRIPDGVIVQSGDGRATVSSCALDVRGGPPLGKLTLTHKASGWVVSGHQNEACPSTTTTTPTG